jgi:hypothetical protein
MTDGFDDIRAIANEEMTKALAALQARDFALATRLLEIATSKLQAIANGEESPKISPE